MTQPTRNGENIWFWKLCSAASEVWLQGRVGCPGVTWSRGVATLCSKRFRKFSMAETRLFRSLICGEKTARMKELNATPVHGDTGFKKDHA